MYQIKIKMRLPNYRDLLRYGEIVSDKEYNTDNVFIRIRKIRYLGILYYLKMKNGKVISLKQWDSFPYTEDENDISELSDEKLSDMFMFSDRDRKNNSMAEKVYWLCVKEINRRIGELRND